MEQRCAGCGSPLDRGTAWVPDDIGDRRRYCFECAPDDAVREKDLMRPAEALARLEATAPGQERR